MGRSTMTNGYAIQNSYSPKMAPDSGRRTPLAWDTGNIFREFEYKLGEGGFRDPRSRRVASYNHPMNSPVPTVDEVMRSATATPMLSSPLYINTTKPIRPVDASPLYLSPMSGSVMSGRSSPFVSPNSRGLAPTPTDQPVTRPVRHGIEGEVDHLTIAMLHNMRTGRGAAGEVLCSKCKEPITPERQGCTAMNETLHLDCFVCVVCGTNLTRVPFSAVNGQPYCQPDFMETFERCGRCRKLIVDEVVVKASGKSFHQDCFLCCGCRKYLNGQNFVRDWAGNVHCATCFDRKYAPDCSACGIPICPEYGRKEGTRIAFGEKFFHLRCALQLA